MKKINILVTGVGGNIGQGIIKAARHSGLDCRVVGIDSNPLSVGLFVVDKGYVVPRVENTKLLGALVKIIRKEAIDIILVGSDPELWFYAKNKGRIENVAGAKVVVSSMDVIKTATDKYLTSEFLRRNNFPYVKSVLCADKKSLAEFIKKNPFPLLIKPRKGYGSANVFIVDSKEELRVFGKRISDAVVQTLVGDAQSEYTTAVVYFKEEGIFEHIIFKRELHSGTTYRAEVIEDKNMAEQIRAITSRLCPFGPCNMQFKYVQGKVVIFEINARFSGTTPMRSMVGFNDVEMVVSHLLFNKMPQRQRRARASVLRYWNEMIVPDSIENISKKKVFSKVDCLISDAF